MSSILSPLVDTRVWYDAGWGGTNTPQPWGGGNPVPSGILANITAGWCGAAFDYATNTFHSVVAGGHNDSWNNACYAIQVPSGSWRVTRPQTTFPPDQHVSAYAGYAGTLPKNNFPSTGVDARDQLPTRGDGFYFNPNDSKWYMVLPGHSRDGVEVPAHVYFDGAPCSRHTYGGTVWLPVQQRVCLFTGAGFGAASDSMVAWFDPSTNPGTWTRRTNMPESGGTGYVTAYDFTRNLVYWFRDAGVIWKYDPAAADTSGAHVRIGVGTGSPIGGSTGRNYNQCCVAGSYLYATTRNGWGQAYPCIIRMPLGLWPTLQKWEICRVYGDVTAMHGNCPGMEYDPDKNALVFYAYEDPGCISVLRLADFRIYRVPISGTPPTGPGTVSGTELSYSPTGIWGRFRRYAPHSYALFLSPAHQLRLITLQ